MEQSNRHSSNEGRRRTARRTRGESDPQGWVGRFGRYLESVLRTFVVLIGLTLIAIALGHLVDGRFVAALVGLVTSETGLWIGVVVFATMLISAARRSTSPANPLA